MGTTGALVLGMLGAPLAQAATAPTSTSVPVPSSKPTLTPEQQGIVDARAVAKATGKPAAVDALTTETALTQVNPDGTLTTVDRIQPVRTKRNGTWADLDATLHKNVDGTLSPAVSSTGLAISGGGSGPMATVTTADGRKLAVSAPFTLPTPTLDGASATYANMLPDVDLQVTALPAGGWRDVIIVRTAAAAADPRLKSLRFPVKAEGLNISADDAGNLTAKDTNGRVRLAAPPPLQWDSTLPVQATSSAQPTVSSRSTVAAPRTAQVTAEPASSAEAPGEQAHQSPMGITADNSSLTLTPDPQTFGKGTGPWYLDPTIAATGQTQAYAQVQEFHPSYTYTSGMSDLGFGYCDYGDCTGTGRQRVYYQIGTPSALLNPPSGASSPVIHDSTLSLQATAASNPRGSTVMQVYDSGGIGSGTTWNNQPCGTDSSPGSHCRYVSSSPSFTGNGQVNLDVTSIIKTAVASGWSNWTLMLAAADETDDAMRHHLSTNPTITTNYDIAPVVSSPRTSPAPFQANTGATAPCESSTQPYWVGAGQNISLTVNNWSPAGLPLLTTFNLWDNDDSTFSWTGNSGWAGSSNPNGVSVAVGSLTDGHQYGWNAQASDTDGSAWGLSSGNTSGCHFRVDKTPPSVSVSSLDFPPSGTQNPSPTKFNTDTGTFTITGTDPVPSTGTRASGLACYRWSANPSPVTNWHCGDSANNVDTGIVAATAASNTFAYTPGTWGANTLYVQAQDNAGNYSQPAAYSFYAPWKPGSMPVFGDLTGDRKPDVVLPDPAGNLRLIQPTLDPATAPAISGAASAAPASST
ncbi:VCBS repeat-containing protein, partial [Saccharothrix sp. ST-888]|uniref:VCBS repeat-containing protein n=1 Tax=Saccharothrix sp. ST-888 TaxID=1427391 RepID=UPI0005EC3309